MTTQSEQDAQDVLEPGQVLADAERESQHLPEVPARSRRVSSRAVPVLGRAGYLR